MRIRCASYGYWSTRILVNMNDDFQALYSRRGRPSIAPERLLRASLIQTLFSIRSKRQLVQHFEYNLLYRWFVGMHRDEPVWNQSTFSANRERLFSEAMTQRLFAQVLRITEWQSLISDEHFTVDGTMIEAWTLLKSFTKNDGSGPPPSDNGRNATVDFKGEKRSNETHQSTTDPDARLYKKGDGDKSRLCYLGHALMENRNGLLVDATTTLASGTAGSSGFKMEWAAARLICRVGGNDASRRAVSVVRDCRLSQTIFAAKSCNAACCERPETCSRLSRCLKRWKASSMRQRWWYRSPNSWAGNAAGSSKLVISTRTLPVLAIWRTRRTVCAVAGHS